MPINEEIKELKLQSTANQSSMEEELLKALPQHTCTWLQGKLTMYKYQQFWTSKLLLEGTILAQQTLKPDPNLVFLTSAPKSGTTWLKSLALAVATRDEPTSPLLTKLVHECFPILERQVGEIETYHKNSGVPFVSTHLPYTWLPESAITSDCKIVYIYRNVKDVIVSNYHYLSGALKVPVEDASFEEAFEDFCQGFSGYGPYWDHILGYWKASLERPDKILLLKYEDIKREPASNVKRLAEFLGYPFSIEEEKAGVVEQIVSLCSFENLSNLEVNKSGKPDGGSLENRLYFRKAKDGDWKNYFTDEMEEKINKLVNEKLSGTGLVLN